MPLVKYPLIFFSEYVDVFFKGKKESSQCSLITINEHIF